MRRRLLRWDSELERADACLCTPQVRVKQSNRQYHAVHSTAEVCWTHVKNERSAPWAGRRLTPALHSRSAPCSATNPRRRRKHRGSLLQPNMHAYSHADLVVSALLKLVEGSKGVALVHKSCCSFAEGKSQQIAQHKQEQTEGYKTS